MKVDIVVRNGKVLDPATGLSGLYDLAILEGKIMEIRRTDSDGEAFVAKAEIHADGNLVVPGLIDLHVHAFPDSTTIGIDADQIGIRHGVATVVDAGSVGVDYFSKFYKEVVARRNTEVLCWINIAKTGLCEGRTELKDIGNVEIDRTVEFIQQWPLIRGIKVRMSSSILGANGLKPLEMAKIAAEKARVPLMVHVGNGPPELKDILDMLDRGDVITHIFHGKSGGIFCADGTLLPAAQKALARGVLFDVGHGKASFNFNTMKRARKAGIKLNTISTDIHLENWQGPVYNLTTTMSKFLALGYAIDEVVAAVTVAPATALRLSDTHGSISVGRPADVTVLNVAAGEFNFTDAENNHLVGKQFLAPQFAIKAGKIFTCS